MEHHGKNQKGCIIVQLSRYEPWKQESFQTALFRSPLLPANPERREEQLLTDLILPTSKNVLAFSFGQSMKPNVMVSSASPRENIYCDSFVILWSTLYSRSS